MEEPVKKKTRYETQDGRVLLSAGPEYLCRIEEAGTKVPEGVGILSSLVTRKVVEAVYRYGAMTAAAIKELLQSDGEKSDNVVKAAIRSLTENGYLYRCICYREDESCEYVRFDYYIIPPALAVKLEDKYGPSVGAYLTNPAYVSQILSISQISTLMTGISGARTALLRDGQTICTKLRYKDRYRLYIVSLRKNTGQSGVEVFGELSKKLNGRLETTRGIVICETHADVICVAKEMLGKIKASQIYGIYFATDFSFIDRELNLMQVKRNTEGLHLIPVTLA